MSGDSGSALYDTATGELRHEFDFKHIQSVIASSPDGKLLAWAAPNGISLWDTTANRRQRLIQNEYVCTIAFSPDGKLMVVSKFAEFIVWDTTTGSPNYAKNVDGDISTTAFISGGTRIVLVQDHTITVWEASTG